MNDVVNWTHEPPTAPGLYLLCYGEPCDDTAKLVRFVGVNGGLYTEDGLQPHDWGDRYRWARLVVGSEARA